MLHIQGLCFWIFVRNRKFGNLLDTRVQVLNSLWWLWAVCRLDCWLVSQLHTICVYKYTISLSKNPIYLASYIPSHRCQLHILYRCWLFLVALTAKHVPQSLGLTEWASVDVWMQRQTLSDNSFVQHSRAPVVRFIMVAWQFFMQCCPMARRSHAFKSDFRPWPLRM